MGSRPARINYEYAYHHVTSRGTAQWLIFLDDEDRRRFLRLLARVCRRYRVEVVAFCLMGNHFHLVLYVPHANLSDAMRDLKSMYATGYNHRHGRTGPVFGARFYSRVITDEQQLLDTVRYSHRNPLDLDPDTDLAGYVWSSHGIYLNPKAKPEWLNPDLPLAMFGSSYRQAIETPRPGDKVQNRRRSSVQAPGAWTLESGPSLAEILVAVAHCADCDVADISPRRRNGLIGIAVLLAVDLGGFTPDEIAEPYGFHTATAVAKQRQRASNRKAHDPEAASVYQRANLLLRQRRAA